LRKYGTQNIISVFGLSISVACFALCFYVVRGFTDMDREFPAVERMFTLMDSARHTHARERYVGEYLRRDFPEVEKYTVIESQSSMLFETAENRGQVVMLHIMEALPSFFDFFSVRFVTAPSPDFETQANGIILCESTAMKLFGSTDIRGEKLIKTSESNNSTYTVCGVIGDFKNNSYFNLHSDGGVNGILLNDENGLLNPSAISVWSGIHTFVMLHKNVQAEAFNKKFNNYSREITGQFIFPNTKYYLSPFTKSAREKMGAMFFIITGVLGSIGLLVLLVSIFNYTSCAINTFLNKQHECAIRKMANAGYIHLFFLFYTEIAIIIILSGLFALLWLHTVMPFAGSFSEMLFVMNEQEIYWQVCQYVVFGLALAAALCIIPVGRIYRKSIQHSLYGGKSRNPKSQIRNILLGLQLFICIIFISGTLFMYLQLRYISSVILDTLTENDKRRIVELCMDSPLLYNNTDEIRQKLKASPDIEEILLTDSPLASSFGGGEWLSYNEQWLDHTAINVMLAGENYADFTNTRLLEGRFVHEGANEIAVTENVKKLLGKENVIGEIIRRAGHKSAYTIVGVTENVLIKGYSDIKATFFMPHQYPSYIYVKINPVKRKEATAYIRSVIRAHLPETVDYSMPALNEIISGLYEKENALLKLIALFSAITVIISLSGVYSSILLATERRRREVAIRKINGATLSDILQLFLRVYLYILAIAAIPAFALSRLLVSRWLESYAYRISLSWTVFALLLISLACLLTLTVIRQLTKTARINPVNEIKR
jgi:ABC-type lipoprotein release transport system permease subunit